MPFQFKWIAGGFIVGMLIASVITPPTRKVPAVPTPSPHDKNVFQTDTGCIHLKPEEVSCDTSEPVSLNLLALKQ